MKFLDKLILPPDNINNIGLYGMTNEFFCAYISKLKKTYNKDILVLEDGGSEIVNFDSKEGIVVTGTSNYICHGKILK